MKAVIVTYTVQEDFAETNAENIRKVMAEMRELADPGIRYQSFRKQDGVTFVHFGMYDDESAVDRMGSVESFKEFQQALRGSNPVSKPNAEWLDVVGSSYSIF